MVHLQYVSFEVYDVRGTYALISVHTTCSKTLHCLIIVERSYKRRKQLWRRRMLLFRRHSFHSQKSDAHIHHDPPLDGVPNSQTNEVPSDTVVASFKWNVPRKALISGCEQFGSILSIKILDNCPSRVFTFFEIVWSTYY